MTRVNTKLRLESQLPDLVAAIFVPAEPPTDSTHRGQVQLLLLGAGRQVQIRQLDHTSTFAESKFHLDIPIKNLDHSMVEILTPDVQMVIFWSVQLDVQEDAEGEIHQHKCQ